MLKLNVTAVIWISLVFLTQARIPNGAKPLSNDEASEFLGQAGPKLISWSKTRGPDFDVYYGRPKSNVSGHVSIYFGYAPDFRPDWSMDTVESTLGKFQVKWQRKVRTDGTVAELTLVSIDRHLKVQVWVEAKNQFDVDKLISEISGLPVFATGKPPPEFRE